MSKAYQAEWQSKCSERSSRMFNPIRDVVDKLVFPAPDPKKPLIHLSLGDPTVFGNIHMHPSHIEAIVSSVQSEKHNGYLPSHGSLAARASVARVSSYPGCEVTADDICIASGCSGALDIVIQVLCNEGDNILIPRPGFSLYQTISNCYGIGTKSYNLLPEKSWEADIEHLETLVDSNTRALLVNNPSNPTGAVYSKQHLSALLAFAEKHKLIVIADEIYGHLVFKGQSFIPMATLTTEVPIISVSGLAKQYICPGWRVGWSVCYDRKERLKEIRPAIVRMSQLVIGANSLVQAVIPTMLEKTPQSFYDDLRDQLELQAFALVDKLSKVQGLKPIVPQGAMYVMVEVDPNQFADIADGTDFSQKLLTEEAVSVLPGACFQAPNFFRCVFVAPVAVLEDAAARIDAFSKRHLKVAAVAE